MGVLRVYRDIYRIDFSSVTGQTYTLINASSIVASSFVRNSLTAIETMVPVLESTGIYYVDLNPILYTVSDIYEIRWSVNYVLNSPTKILTTRFKMKPVNFTGGAFVEVIDNQIEIILQNAS